MKSLHDFAHSASAAVVCANVCGDHCFKVRSRSEGNYPQIWIPLEKSLVIWTPATVIILNPQTKAGRQQVALIISSSNRAYGN